MSRQRLLLNWDVQAAPPIKLGCSGSASYLTPKLSSPNSPVLTLSGVFLLSLLLLFYMFLSQLQVQKQTMNEEKDAPWHPSNGSYEQTSAATVKTPVVFVYLVLFSASVMWCCTSHH